MFPYPTWGAPGGIGSTTPNTGAFTSLTLAVQITSTGDTVTLTNTSPQSQISTATDPVTYNLPSSAANAGLVFTFVAFNDGEIVLVGDGSDNVYCAPPYPTPDPLFNQSVTIQADGQGNWNCMASTQAINLSGDIDFDVLQIVGTIAANDITAGEVTVSTAIANNCAVTTYAGTAGDIYWSQPEVGSGYKKVVIVLSGYTKSSTHAITFTTAFTHTPQVTFNGTGLTTPTPSTTGVTIPAATTASGVMVIEGI
jgi:hypothetical protein